MARPSTYLSASLGSILLLASNAYAADIATTTPGGFSVELNGSQNFTYDSNALRATTNEQEIFGSTTSPELVVRRKTPTSLIESTTRVDVNFFDQSEFDSVDAHEDLLLSRSNQRWTANLRTLFDYDTTRTSEITNYGINKTGVHRTKIEVKPQIIFRSTERDSWLLTTSASNATYDDNAYVDYRYYSVSPSYEHQFDPKNKGTIALNAHRYESTSGATSIADSYGPSLGWTTQVTPRLILQANAGALATEKRGAAAGPDRSSWDYVFSAAAIYKGTQDEFDFSATRERAPFGNGTETLLDTFKITERHHINKKLDVTAQAVYREADYPAQPGVNLDTEYSLGAGIAYKIVDDVALTADYTYRNEELTNTAGSVDQHIAMVGVTLNPPWSRGN